jgi:hypothetical protein
LGEIKGAVDLFRAKDVKLDYVCSLCFLPPVLICPAVLRIKRELLLG